MYSEVESPSIEVMDYLVEAVAGEYGYFYIQAKDAFGNNQITGGDDFQVTFTNTDDSSIVYRGNVDDHGDGTYTVRYTIRVAGYYIVDTTLTTSASGEAEKLLQCVSASSDYIFDRYYNGETPYVEPSFCNLTSNILNVVHNDLYAPASTPLDTGTELVTAIVGETNYFYVEARDEFGNLRRGNATSNFLGYGDGQSDYFLVEFTQTETGDYHAVSSAVDKIEATFDTTETEPYFTLTFGGKTTGDIHKSTTATGLEAILESLHDYQLDVVVTQPAGNGAGGTYTWMVTFLTMLDVWQSRPPSGGEISTGVLSGAITGGSGSVAVHRDAFNGTYPIDFTLWHTGSYLVHITNNGVDIATSPFTLTVNNNNVDATASIASGAGLTGGVAGEPISVTVQAKDKRQKTVEYIVSEAEIVSYQAEVQVITLSSLSTAFKIGFRNQQTTSTISLGDTWDTLRTKLNELDSSGVFPSSSFSGFTFGSDLKAMTPGGVEITDTSQQINSGDMLEVSFVNTGLIGPLPDMKLSLSSAGSVATTVPGDAPYRAEVQVFECTDNSLGDFEFVIGDHVSAAISSGSRSLNAVEGALNAALAGTKYELTANAISMAYRDGSTATGVDICDSAQGPALITFGQYMGPVPDIVVRLVSDKLTPSGLGISQSEDDGALGGISPLWGEWALGIRGENTTALSFDATAAEVETAIEALYSVGDVTVSRDGFGRAYDSSGLAISPARYQFYVWAVTFSADCTGNFGNQGVAQIYCPASLGDEPVFDVNTDNVDYLSSPHAHQARPVVKAVKSLKGYPGNTRDNHDDYRKVSVELAHRTISDPQVPEIGMHEKQILYCRAQAATSGPTEKFVFQIMNDTVPFTVSDSGSYKKASDFETAINNALRVTKYSNYSITVLGENGSGNDDLCAAWPYKKNTIEFNNLW